MESTAHCSARPDPDIMADLVFGAVTGHDRRGCVSTMYAADCVSSCGDGRISFEEIEYSLRCRRRAAVQFSVVCSDGIWQLDFVGKRGSRAGVWMVRVLLDCSVAAICTVALCPCSSKVGQWR